ncbi:unnamed protein product [Staurois parvus]|uniref:Uncharacterized protein n=1 Tax=Staurois parvus TaxID=386267 RepID=A0ABN9GRI5_9NEOB|nr:unnamed protein product [Staurois parvus]
MIFRGLIYFHLLFVIPRGGLTIWKLGTARGPGMPLVPFS